MPENLTSKKRGFGLSKKKLLKFIFAILVILAFAWLAFSYRQAKKQIVYLSSPEAQQEVSQKEIAELKEIVGKLILLPDGEDPTVATIQDVEALVKEQPFFKNAKNGDKLLIFKETAMIYSPETGKLINVGPVYAQEAPAEGETAEETPAVEILNLDIRNGSETAGKARDFADKLGKDAKYKVVNVIDADKKDYKDTVLVNLTGKDVSALEAEFNVKAVKDLPGGEKESTADVVIITGGK